MNESDSGRLIELCREIWKSKPQSRKGIESLVSGIKAGTIPIASAERIVFLLIVFNADLARITVKV